MSRIAELRVVKREHVPVLRDAYLKAWNAVADDVDALDAEKAYHDVVERYGHEVPFDWSGDILLHLTTYLEEQDIELGELAFCPPPLERGEEAEPYEAVTCVMPESKEALDSELDPASYDPAAIAQHFEEMGYGYNDSGADALQVLALLREVIGGLADDEVLLIREY